LENGSHGGVLVTGFVFDTEGAAIGLGLQ
jgi:hypothetical protein